ncbi:MAG: Imm30 family immunity protein [Alphaproteobacteria bacterium]
MNKFDQVRQYTKFANREDIDNFEKAVWGLAASGDPEVLRKLLDLFDDECPYDEVMHSLMHAIETYPAEVYVKILLEKLEDLVKKSPFWARVLVVPTWNHPMYLSIFRSCMSLASEVALLDLFDIVEKELPHRHDLITEFRKELAATKADN